MSAEDARALVAYAAHFHITVVPEQEAFGHVHHLLNWEMYAPLAETPHGNVLAPGQPESLALTQRMFQQLAALYPGPFLHIGADETVELGKGQTKAQVDSRGLGAVYLETLQRITQSLAPLHRKLLFWGDIAMHEPELVKQLPPDFKACAMGRYESDAWTWRSHVQASLSYIGDRNSNLVVSDETKLGFSPGYTQLDASAGATRGNTTVELYVRNLNDVRGEQTRTAECNINYCGPSKFDPVGEIYRIYNQPRTLGLRFGQKF